MVLLKAVCGQRGLRSAFSGHSIDSCQFLLSDCPRNGPRAKALLLPFRAADKPPAYVSKDARVSPKVSFAHATFSARRAFFATEKRIPEDARRIHCKRIERPRNICGPRLPAPV